MTSAHQFVYPLELPDGTETSYNITFDLTAGYPARLYGPPESCYPAEPPEIEITEVIDEEGEDILYTLSDEEYELIETSCWEEVERLQTEAQEP